MDVSKYLSNEVRKNLKEGIEDAGGNEVFFTGDIDEKGLVVRAKIGSRGTENTVPVNFFDACESSVLIHNHPSGNLKPSDADLAVASKSSQKGQGFYIINDDASDIYVVVEPVLPRKITKVDAEKAGEYISDGGRLSKISENFEERPVQIELLENIVKTFNENKIAVFEAGTGVGKSFSYLIPSVLWALENNERVVVSTGTISLQQQLCEKDIPFVEKILEKKIKYVLMKGRQNYICRRRLVDAASILDLFEEDTQELKKIAEWAENSATGSKSDLSFMPSENVWTKVNSESDACMGMRCPFHKDCFVMKVRKEAAGANLIVVNHHLLFADIQSRINGSGYDDAAVLPPYRHIVFDEAHGIESAATSFFSESVNKFKIYKLVNPMYRKRKNNASGYLCTIALLSSEEEKADNAHEITVAIKNSLLNVELAAKDLLGDEYTMRLFEGTARNFGPLLVSLNELIKNISLFNDLVMQIMEGVNDDDKDVPAFFEAKIILRRLQDVVCLLKDFIVWDEKRDCVFWVQKKHLSPAMIKEKDDENSDYFTFTQTPLDISKLMSSGVFEQMESVICTSATLKTGRDFNYWMRRTGVNYSEWERVLCGEYTSPFPYHKNMLFAVPSDAPLSGSMEFQQYIETALSALIQAAEGRTLVLFTSYESLKSAHKTVSLKLRGFTGRIMKQGDDDNGKLLDAFKKEKESVLFATDSFWQGIDIPGESLSQVIIVKLPFTVPNDPVFVARAEAIEKKGGSSFMELSVPEAVIKYRQGIGRLIRRSDDKGVVVVLDRRIYEKRYGQIFIASMPDCKKVYEPLSEITKKINAFIFE
ncbi:helicase C-terminal domain-containing protein [Treponema sp. Marseille-Q3903]|uniref:helicase C-terminal domain-containing protein n=1 Tax=Treponema sp. Marseille-Q3903 TaxID=2766703 RepID=UPI001652482C|nr:helicase C-terminal domain-containing protein [Treponema sp. Marseille-Q3903]MBC6713465.1 DEAD/DEAH box helicase family protein [Treponema sp. Marseille-Q3903]